MAGFHLPAIEQVVGRFPPPARAEQGGVIVAESFVVIREVSVARPGSKETGEQGSGSVEFVIGLGFNRQVQLLVRSWLVAFPPVLEVLIYPLAGPAFRVAAEGPCHSACVSRQPAFANLSAASFPPMP
ncbi:hypothetical protein E4U58_001178 [Claviceps cyperi]|nr:hypothetical protein E4U58_001178 [Claviceps cyperi]